ncbi:MAG: TraB/GumN family protein [Aquabacterium sp.]
MHRLLRPLAAMAGLIAALAGPAPVRAQAQASAADGAPRQGFVWQATRGDRQLVLVATIHAAPPGLTSVPAGVPTLLAGAQALAVEADTRRQDALAQAVQRHGMLPADAPDLWQRLPAPLADRTRAALRRLGLQEAAFARMQPWMLTVTLATVELARAGFDPEAGSEIRLLGMAAQAGRPVIELEGTELQLSLFARMAPAMQAAMLERLLDQLDDGTASRELAQLSAAWRDGSSLQMDAVIDRMTADAARHPADRLVAEDLLVARHPALLDAIEQAAARHSPLMVAVGALHWFGPQGLRQGLRGRGWTVHEAP